MMEIEFDLLEKNKIAIRNYYIIPISIRVEIIIIITTFRLGRLILKPGPLPLILFIKTKSVKQINLFKKKKTLENPSQNENLTT